MKRSLRKLFGFNAVFCFIPLIILLGTQNSLFPAATYEIDDYSLELKNNFRLNYELSSDYNYSVLTDGKFFAAEKLNQTVYGGPYNEGEADGSNASAVINAAIASLNHTGGKIKVLSGNYPINTKIVFCSNIELHCVEGTLFNLDYNGVLFEFAGVRFSGVKDAEVYGNRDNFVGTPIVIKDYLDIGSSHISITNSHIFYSGAHGISIEGPLSNSNNISYNVIEDTMQEGIMISRSSNNTISSNIVEKMGLHGIISTGGSFNTISRNSVNNSGANYVAGFSHGIAVDGNEGLNACYGNVVTENSVTNCYMAGIEVADGAHNSTITNNYVANTNDYGIYFGGFFAPSFNGVISGNTIYRCGLRGDQGIIISGEALDKSTSNVIVSNNIIEKAGRNGIYLKWTEKIQIKNNSCVECAGYCLALEQSNVKSIFLSENGFLPNYRLISIF